MKIIKIIPLSKDVFREELTYFSMKEVVKGDIVDTLVRNKKITGLVISSEDASASKVNIKNLDFNLKKITELKGKSIFLEEYLNSAFAIADYFVINKNKAISSFIPTAFLQNYEKISKIISFEKSSGNREPNEKKLKIEKLLFQNEEEDRIAIYKTLIRGAFAKKKSIFMVFPRENDINRFYGELSKGIESFTMAIHGNLSIKKQLEIFEKIVKSDHPLLILGTAPYLSIPRRDYDSIILEQESSSFYKNFLKENIDTRIFVEIYASKIGAKLILADSLLRFETLARKELDNLGEVSSLSYRINNEKNIRIIQREGKFQLFNNLVIKEIEEALEKKEKIFIFSLRKGLATMTLCRDCGETLMCKKCLAPLVLYLSKNKNKRMFVCNRCGDQKDPETMCNFCGSWNLYSLGIGTDMIYQEVKKLLNKVPVFQLDREMVKNNKEIEKIIKDFEEAEKAILIGTEMTLAYLNKPIYLSLIASFDSLWSIPNYKMGEKIIKLIISILAKTQKKLIIQTKNKEDPAIEVIERENLVSFVREEIKDRKDFNYPPFQRFIKITHSGNKKETLLAKDFLEKLLEEYQPLIFSGFIAKERDKYITHALIKINPKNWSLEELSNNGKIEENLLNKLKPLAPNFFINIDPEDLL